MRAIVSTNVAPLGATKQYWQRESTGLSCQMARAKTWAETVTHRIPGLEVVDEAGPPVVPNIPQVEH